MGFVAALGFVVTVLIQVTWDAVQQRRKMRKLYSDWARTKAGRK